MLALSPIGVAPRARMGGMSEIQPIMCHGRVTAVVVAGQAIIPDAIPEREQLTVKAMCLYALEIAEGLRPGPYTDTAALAYAHAAAAQRN
jgi:hypothetical protein